MRTGYSMTLSGWNCRKGGLTQRVESSLALRAEVMGAQKVVLKAKSISGSVANGSNGGCIRWLKMSWSDHRGVGGLHGS